MDGDRDIDPPPPGAPRSERRLRTLVPRTLRWRLAISVALLIAVSFAITFTAVYRGTGSTLSHQIDREIAGDAEEFSHTLAASSARSPAQVRAAAQRYVQNQPYTGTSTLLYALVRGVAPATNQPELLRTRAAPDAGETVQDQARENEAAARLLHASSGYSKVEQPDVGELRLLTRRVVLPGGTGVIIGVGQPLAQVRSAQQGVARAFILAGILVLACALAAGYLIGTRFSAPLRRMAGVAARVDGGDLHPRIHETPQASEEVRVLAESFDHMLDRLAEAFASQRAFAADASHELRTPLTVIRGQLELLAVEPDPGASEVRRVSAVVQAEIARLSRLVDDLLLLAKAEREEFLRRKAVDLEPWVGELWTGMLQVTRRRLELGEVPAGTLEADPDRLAQALRNLIGNAIDHTAAPDGLVRLSILAMPAATRKDHLQRHGAGRVRFVVDDDGPGIPAGQREQVFERFHRTDAARDRRSGGAGLGLAIVRAIAEAHGGGVTAGPSPEGGARVELELPGFTPHRAGVPRDADSAVAPPSELPASSAGLPQ